MMKLWTRPQYYIGPDWPNHYVAYAHHRDSDLLTESNWSAFTREVNSLPEPADWPHEESCYTIVRESHFLVGWVEWLAIHRDWQEGINTCNDLLDNMDSYPVLDEEDLSQRQYNADYDCTQDAVISFANSSIDDDVPDSEIEEVVRIILNGDYDSGGRDGQGYWPDDNVIQGAFEHLGYEFDKEAQ